MQTNQNQIALLVSLSVCATLFACAQDDSSALSREATSEDRANGTLELVWVDGQSEVLPLGAGGGYFETANPNCRGFDLTLSSVDSDDGPDIDVRLRLPALTGSGEIMDLTDCNTSQSDAARGRGRVNDYVFAGDFEYEVRCRGQGNDCVRTGNLLTVGQLQEMNVTVQFGRSCRREMVCEGGSSALLPGVLVFDSASQSFECASDGLEMSCFELN